MILPGRVDRVGRVSEEEGHDSGDSMLSKKAGFRRSIDTVCCRPLTVTVQYLGLCFMTGKGPVNGGCSGNSIASCCVWTHGCIRIRHLAIETLDFVGVEVGEWKVGTLLISICPRKIGDHQLCCGALRIGRNHLEVASWYHTLVRLECGEDLPWLWIGNRVRRESHYGENDGDSNGDIQGMKRHHKKSVTPS